MKIMLLILFLIFCPILLGYGTEKIVNLISDTFCKLTKKEKKACSRMKKPFLCRTLLSIPTGSIVIIFISGICNLLALFLDLSVTTAIKIFAIILIFVLTVCYLALIISKVKSALNNDKKETERKKASFSPLLIIFFALSIFAICITASGKAYTVGDQSLEIVNSFIGTNHFFSKNPLTGIDYTSGFPTRSTLECLPFLYAVLSKTFDISPSILLWQIMPTFWLINGICGFYKIGCKLFDESKALVFSSVCILLIFCSDIAYGAVGFSILHSGWRNISVLALLIINWILDKIIDKSWIAAVIGIIIEPLIIANQYVLGVCFILTLICFIFSKIGGTKHEQAK